MFLFSVSKGWELTTAVKVNGLDVDSAVLSYIWMGFSDGL